MINSTFDLTSTQSLTAQTVPKLGYFSSKPTERIGEISTYRGSASNDYLSATSGRNRLYGLAGDDVLMGADGADELNGGTGNDFLKGKLGNDVLIDLDGGDLLSGGAGADLFQIAGARSSESLATISDFEVGIDTIKIADLGTTYDQLVFTDAQTGVEISSQGRAIALLTGIRASDLRPESFFLGDPQLATQLQSALEEGVRNGGSPGGTSAVVTSDGFTWTGAAGFADLEQQIPMQTDSVLGIASISKTFTSAAIVKLAEEGRLSLDDTIGQRLPEFAQQVPNSQSVTIRQLLNGTSELGTTNQVSDINVINKIINGETVTAQEALFPTFYGTPSVNGWRYPNFQTAIASVMAENATGQSFASLLRETILEPLGLDDTSLAGQEAIVGDLAKGYQDLTNPDQTGGPDGTLEDQTQTSITNISAFSGSGAIYSTAEDVARFTRALFGGELLKQDSLNQMLSFVDQIPEFAADDGTQYGLGFASGEVNQLGKFYSKGGDSVGYKSQMYYFPDQQGETIVTLVNRNVQLENILRSQAGDPSVSTNPIVPAILSTLTTLNGDFAIA
jgi:CubicO group peptidase (beta-lactamase class C family)